MPTDSRQHGTDAEGTVRAPFLIHDPERVWVVESGSVDLFLVEIRGEKLAGARHHVLRVKPREAVFGMEIPPRSHMRLLAVGTPGSRVLELPLERVQELLNVTGLVEGWISGLSAVSAGDALPKIFEFLEPGEVSIGKKAKAVMPREGVLWVRRLTGKAHFLGDHHLLLPEGDDLFPVSASGWLQVEKHSALSVVETAEYFRQDPLWAGLQIFHSTALHCLLRNLHLAGERETSRLERREKSEGNRLDSALRLLASPLEPGQDISSPEESGDDLWMAACVALEKSLGIRFAQDQEGRRASAFEDPVGAIASASGVRARSVALRGDWWKRDNGPLLARRETDKIPVALVPASARRYKLYDPSTRTSIAVDEKVASSLESFAWHFYRPFPPRKLNAVDLIRFGLQGSKEDLARILLTAIAVGLLALAIPVLTGTIFDSIIPGANRPQLLQVFLFLIVVAISATLFRASQGLALVRLEGRMESSIQAAVWDRLLSLPVPFFRDYTAGDLAARSLSISWMRQILTGPVLSSAFTGIFSVFSFSLLFYYSWKLAVLAAALTFVAMLVTALLGALEVGYRRESAKLHGHLSGLLLELINGISKLRVAGAENRAFAAWAAEFARVNTVTVRSRNVNVVLAVFTSAFPVLCFTAIFYAVSQGLNAGSFSTGEFLAFIAAFAQFQFAALSLAASFVSLLSIVPLYERAKPILEGLPEVSKARSHPGELSGGIELKHVSFRYRPDSPLVLRDFSMKVPAGQFVAIVGPSGGGKSTLFRMLLGFEAPASGSIYFDNQDLAHLDIQAVRRQIGVVLQSGRILGDSIFNNIIGSAPLRMEDAWEAARMAGLEADLKAMPMGMHTVIAEGGGGLSGGQRQRLMIARAIVRKPRILLFDEATSALDNETQSIVSRSLESLQATRLVIAHRLSTVASADYIYVMDKGVAVQEGTYEELMRQEGPFADLAKRQIA